MLARSIGSLAFVFFTLFPVGCERTIRPTSDTHIKKDATLEELLALYDLRFRELSSLKGLARVEVTTPSIGKQGFQAALYLTRPDGFRMRGFNLFGGTLFELEYQEGENRLFIPGEEHTVGMDELLGPSGPLPPGFSDFLGIPQVVSPEIPVLEKKEEHFYLMMVEVKPDQLPQLKKKFVIERSNFHVEQAIYYSPSGFPEVTLSYEDFREVQEFLLPFKVTGESPYGEARLRFMEMVANPPPKKLEVGSHAAPSP